MLIAALWKNSLEPHDDARLGHAGAGAGAPRSAAARPGDRRAMTWLHDVIVWLGGLLIALAAAIGLGGDRGPLHVQGYVEGEYVYVGAPVAGRLETLHVARGAQVAAGAPLFQLDRSSEQPARDEAAARLARAEANLANLRKGKRPSEIESIEAQLAQAEAMLQWSEVGAEAAGAAGRDPRRQPRSRGRGARRARPRQGARRRAAGRAEDGAARRARRRDPGRRGGGDRGAGAARAGRVASRPAGPGGAAGRASWSTRCTGRANG